MESPSKDIFNVLDEFIAAIEETKQVLQSPCVPGRICYCERPRRKSEHCDCEFLQSRLMGSEDELHRYGDNKYDKTVFFTQHTSREKEAEGLVTEMNYLLNQISTAANSLKKIYNRRSSPEIDDIWRVSCFQMVFLSLMGFWKCSLWVMAYLKAAREGMIVGTVDISCITRFRLDGKWSVANSYS